MSKELSVQIKSIFMEHGIIDALQGYHIDFDAIILKIASIISIPEKESNLKNKLNIIYENEKHYLELIKEYKEEIKFANNIQEEIRKERVQFFTNSLKEVANSLKELQVESNVASNWIQDLVSSYTKSLDLSSELANSSAIDVIGKLRMDSKKIISDVKEDNE